MDLDISFTVPGTVMFMKCKSSIHIMLSLLSVVYSPNIVKKIKCLLSTALKEMPAYNQDHLLSRRGLYSNVP